jgi:hypothetical protein
VKATDHSDVRNARNEVIFRERVLPPGRWIACQQPERPPIDNDVLWHLQRRCLTCLKKARNQAVLYPDNPFVAGLGGADGAAHGATVLEGLRPR